MLKQVFLKTKKTQKNSIFKLELFLIDVKLSKYLSWSLNQSSHLSTQVPVNVDDIKAAKNFNISTYGRGTGGRSSFNGNVVTVFGATGVTGRILANRLGKEGSQIVIAYRGDVWDARSLKLVGDLGQTWFQVRLNLCIFGLSVYF